MKNLYEQRAKRLITKRYLEILKEQVYPLTSLPIELHLDTEISDGYFHASASIGHPHFGYFGLAMKGFVLDFLGIPTSLYVDNQKTFIYPVRAEGDHIVLDGESPAFSSTDIRRTAVTANKLLFLNEVLTGAVPAKNFEIAAKNINAHISGMLAGRI